MKANIKQLNADVYHLDIGGVNGLWIWDFGSFTLLGDENRPTRVPSNMSIYSAVCDELDVMDFENKEPDFQNEVNIYLGDYVVYVESDLDNAKFFINKETNKIYRVITSGVRFDESDDNGVVLESTDQYEEDKRILSENEILSDWIPVIRIPS